MTIPLLDRTGTGLAVGRDAGGGEAVHLVTLRVRLGGLTRLPVFDRAEGLRRRLFGPPRVVRRTSVPLDPALPDPLGAALEALRARVPERERAVHAALRPSDVRVDVAAAPEFDDAEDLAIWQESQAARRAEAHTASRPRTGGEGGPTVGGPVVVRSSAFASVGLDAPGGAGSGAYGAGVYGREDPGTRNPGTSDYGTVGYGDRSYEGGAYGGSYRSPQRPSYAAGTRVAFALADATAVERLAARLRDRGFAPLRVGTGLVEYASLFALDRIVLDRAVLGGAALEGVFGASGGSDADGPPEDEGAERGGGAPVRDAPVRDALVRVDGQGGASLVIAGGRPCDVLGHDFGAAGRPVPDVPPDLARYVTAPGSGASGSGAPDSGAPDLEAPGPARVPTTLLPPDALAVALAAEALYPGLALLDVLPEAEAEAARAARAKGEAQRAVLAVGALLLALLLAVNVLGVGLGALAARSEAALAEAAPELLELEALRARVSRLERDVAAAGALARDRTAQADALALVARALPEGVWLERVRQSVSIPSTGAGGYAVEIEGLSETGGGVAALLGALEADPAVRDVALTGTLRLTEREVARLPATVRQGARAPLTRFALRFDVVP